MSIIKTGTTYKVYPDSVELMNEGLPAKIFGISFNPMSGFSLFEKDDLIRKEEKIYGKHEDKANKIMKTFNALTRSLGVLISGDKGIGKTLTVQLLAEKLREENIPTIIVDENWGGLPGFIESIPQPCLFVFDEFEKKFPTTRDGDGCTQEDLLSIFDGLTSNKHLFAVTVNETNRVNSYMLNRPGRFHYHITYDYPDREEISEYFRYHNPGISDEEIDDISNIAARTNLNFDMLRAISFEISQGYTVVEALEDLNITIGNEFSKTVVLTTKNDTFIEDAEVTLFGEQQEINFSNYRYSRDSRIGGRIKFAPGALMMNSEGLSLDLSKIKDANLYDYTKEDEEGDYLRIPVSEIKSIVIQDKSSVFTTYLI